MLAEGGVFAALLVCVKSLAELLSVCLSVFLQVGEASPKFGESLRNMHSSQLTGMIFVLQNRQVDRFNEFDLNSLRKVQSMEWGVWGRDIMSGSIGIAQTLPEVTQ